MDGADFFTHAFNEPYPSRLLTYLTIKLWDPHECVSTTGGPKKHFIEGVISKKYIKFEKIKEIF